MFSKQNNPNISFPIQIIPQSGHRQWGQVVRMIALELVDVLDVRFFEIYLCYQGIRWGSLSWGYIPYIPHKYPHKFSVLCFVVVILYVLAHAYDACTDIYSGCLPQCQWCNPDEYRLSWPALYHNITQQSTNHVHNSWYALFHTPCQYTSAIRKPVGSLYDEDI